MPTDDLTPGPATAANEADATEQRRLPAAARRALAEAAARRAARQSGPDDQPKEVDGRPGPDPTRFGDWEVNGLAADF